MLPSVVKNEATLDLSSEDLQIAPTTPPAYDVDQAESEEFVEKSNYIYLTSIVVKDEYRKKHYGSSLQEAFLKDNRGKKIVLLTVSMSGYTLANKYFRLIRQIDDKHNIFVNKN